MKLLASVISVTEAGRLADVAALVDVKNPARGPLGAPDPALVREIRRALGPSAPLSAALGDLVPDRMETVELARQMAEAGATHVKAGLARVSFDQARATLRMVKNALDPRVAVIAAAYGDAEELGLFPPGQLPELALEAGIDGVMVDTCRKDGRSLFDHQKPETVGEIISRARALGLQTALAGALGEAHLPILGELSPDWAGFRTALTANGDRAREGVDRMRALALSGMLAAARATASARRA